MPDRQKPERITSAKRLASRFYQPKTGVGNMYFSQFRDGAGGGLGEARVGRRRRLDRVRKGARLGIVSAMQQLLA